MRFQVPPVRHVVKTGKHAGRWLLLALEQIDRADAPAAMRRVQHLRARQPGASTADLVEQLIREKCRQAALIGAASAGTGVVPGLGTLAALTLGTAAGVGALLRLQAELVLEVAAVHGQVLDAAERRRALLVAVGAGAGATRLLASGGRMSLSLVERYAACWVARAVPVAGMGAAAAANAATTYVIGRRAHAYFGRGPEAAGGWRAGLRALSSLDERRLAGAAARQVAAIRQYVSRHLPGLRVSAAAAGTARWGQVAPATLSARLSAADGRLRAQSGAGQGLPARKPPSTAKTWPVA